mgnify:CR=1 FL=1
MEFNCKYDERQLLRDMANGVHAAFDIVITHYQPIFYSAALKWTKDKALAKDIVQNVFINTWVFRQTLSRVENLEAYLFSILKRKCYLALAETDEVVRLKREWEEEAERLGYIEKNASQNPRVALLEEAVETLSPQRKMACSLYFFNGLSRRQVAEQMNLSLETVKTHIKKGRQDMLAFCKKRLPHSLVLLLAGKLL